MSVFAFRETVIAGAKGGENGILFLGYRHYRNGDLDCRVLRDLQDYHVDPR